VDVPREQESTIAVVGLWHLGAVIAACLAEAGFTVVGVDPDPEVVADLNEDRPPVEEPGLTKLLHDMRTVGRLTFAEATAEALGAAGLVWIAFDTPVDDEDRADVEWVLKRSAEVLAHAAPGALVVLSGQLPVGSAGALGSRMADTGRGDLRYACVPENVRLGRALQTFHSPDRFVAGVRSEEDRARLAAVLERFGRPVEWMGVESAEMTKHALNAFLATSVAFINEVAAICEALGADASDVARGLKSEERIGPRAYLAPGDAFAGGTLARDIRFLTELAHDQGLSAAVVDGVAASNAEHRNWSRRALTRLFGLGSGDGKHGLAGRRIAVWGLTYKPGTNTLRRSSALELCRWLAEERASVQAYDPAISALPAGEPDAIELAGSPLAALQGADALVVCTPWPEFRQLPADTVAGSMTQPVVVDPGGHLRETLGHADAVRYVRVGVTAG
jgi:UDPglucose 6-dehydrogenase